MGRELTREEKLRIVDEALAGPAGAPCATCREVPAASTYTETCKGIEMEKRGAMPAAKDGLAAVLSFEGGEVLRCGACGGLYYYLRDYDSEPGFGWELSESLERLDAAEIRARLAELLESRPATRVRPAGVSRRRGR